MAKRRLFVTAIAVVLSIVGFSTLINNMEKSIVLDTFAQQISNQIVCSNANRITFSSDEDNKIYRSEFSSPNNNRIFLIASESPSFTDSNGLCAFRGAFDSEYNPSIVKFYKDADGIEPFKFQNISSVVLVDSKDQILTIQCSSDGVNYYEKADIQLSANVAGSYSNFSSFDRYISITVKSSNYTATKSYLKEFTVIYTCDNVDPETLRVDSMYSGKAVNTSSAEKDVDIIFNSDLTGEYRFHANNFTTYISKFTWVYNKLTSNVTITFASGGTGSYTQYQGCCIFSRHAVLEDPITTEIAVVGKTLSVFLYDVKSSSSYSVRDSATLF